MTLKSSLLLKCSLCTQPFQTSINFWGAVCIPPRSGPQRVNASCLELFFSLIIFLTWLFKVFCTFPKHLLLYNLILKKKKFVISPDLLVLVCECAFSFWFLLLYPRILFVWPSRCLFSSFFSWLCMPLYSKWLISNFTSVSLTNLL